MSERTGLMTAVALPLLAGVAPLDADLPGWMLLAGSIVSAALYELVRLATRERAARLRRRAQRALDDGDPSNDDAAGEDMAAAEALEREAARPRRR